MNLLSPGLPARRARTAAVMVAVLLIVALFDLAMVLVWAGFTVRNDRAEAAVEMWQAEEARWQAEAARYAGTLKDRGHLVQQLEILNRLPAGYDSVEALARHLDQVLPEGTSIASVSLGQGRFVLITGSASSYESVERYARALQAGGMFEYVRVAAASRGSQGNDEAVSAAPGAGGVSFQIEGWLKGAGEHGGGV